MLKIALSLLLFMTTAANAWAGWVITEQSQGKTSQFYIQDNALKDNNPAMVTLFDVEKGKIYFYKPKERVIWTGAPNQFLEEMEQARRTELEALMATAPPEKRAAMRKGLDAQMKAIKTPQKYQVKIVGPADGGKVAGHSTQKYQIFVENQLQEEIWLANLPGLGKDLDLAKFAKLSRSFLAPGVRSWETDPKILAVRAKGWPLKSIEYGPGGEKDESLVTGVEKRQIKKFLFDPPKGYRAVTLMQILR